MVKHTIATTDNQDNCGVDILAMYGMPRGNKLSGNLHVPKWIFDSASYMKMFIRGLFDTDGCVFLDKHVINGKRYEHLGWAMTSAADTLLVDVQHLLRMLGYNPTWRNTQNSVYLRKQVEVRGILLRSDRQILSIGDDSSDLVEGYRSGHNGTDSKSVGGASSTWVRIPPLPFMVEYGRIMSNDFENNLLNLALFDCFRGRRCLFGIACVHSD